MLRTVLPFFLTSSTRLAGAFSALMLAIFVARDFDQVTAGQYFLLLNVVGVLVLVVSLGLPSVLLKCTSIDSEKGYIKGRWLSALKRISLAWICTVLLLVVFFDWTVAYFDAQEAEYIVLVLPAILYGHAILLCNTHVLQGFHQATVSSVLQSLAVPLSLLLVLLFLNVTFSVFLYIYIFSLFASVAVSALMIWRRLATKGEQKPAALPASGQFYSLDLIGIILAQGGLLIVAGLVTLPQFAILSAANTLAASVGIALVSINLVVAPRFAQRYAAGDLDGFKRQAQLASLLSVLVGLPFLAALLVFPEQVMSLYGDSFSDGGELLTVLVVGQLINAITGPSQQLLKMSGYERDLKFLSLLVCLFLLVTVPVLTLWWGVLGGAVALSLTVALQNIGAFFVVRLRHGFFCLPSVRIP